MGTSDDVSTQGVAEGGISLAQAMMVGWTWAVEHGVGHNHNTLFHWGAAPNPKSKYGEYIDVPGTACAMGFAHLGALLLSGMDPDELLYEAYPLYLNGFEGIQRFRDLFRPNEDELFRCPHIHKTVDPVGNVVRQQCDSRHGVLSDLVVHLNDRHEWTMDQIIRFVLEQEPDSMLELAAAVPAIEQAWSEMAEAAQVQPVEVETALVF